MSRLYSLLILAISLFLSCTSAKEAYQKGDYESAIRKSLKEIKSEHDVRQNKSLLNNSFQKRYQELNSRFLARNASSYLKMEKLYLDYGSFEELSIEVRPYLDDSNLDLREKLQRETDVLQDEICLFLYEKGTGHYDTARVKKDKKEARLAYEAFETLASYDTQNKYKETSTLMDKAFELAVYHYQFDIDHGFNISESWEIKSQFSRLSNKGSKFKKFYVDSSCKTCDCIIELNFRELRESRHSSKEVKTFEKKIEDGFTTTKDDKGNIIKVPIFKTLKGQVEIEKTRFDFNWEIRSDVRKESSACDADYRTFDASRSIDLMDYHLSGDLDAIPSEYKSFQKPRLDRDDIIEDLLEDLFNQVANYYD